MAMCNRCLKRGLFLKLDKNGHCETCAREVIEEQHRKDEARRKEEERLRAEARRQEEEKRQRELELKRRDAFMAEEARKAAAARAKAAADALMADKRQIAALDEEYIPTYSYVERIFVPDDRVPAYASVPDERRLNIALDPKNPYDPGAVSLALGDKIVAYFYKGARRDMVVDFLDPDRGVVVAVKNGRQATPTIDLTFYEKRVDYVDKLLRKGNAKEFKLVATSGSEAQDALAYLSPADPVEVSENIEGQMEVCTDAREVIGRLPASAAKFIGDHEIAQARISENDYDPSTDKYSASVVILLKK